MDPQEGSIREPRSLNRYTYCADDPVNWADNTGEDAWGQHIIPRSLWDERDIEFKFSGDAKRFFHSREARIPDIDIHNNARPHAAYTEVVRDEARKFLAETGIKPSEMTTEEARTLLKAMRKNKAVAGYLSVVGGGPKRIAKWLYEEGGWKLFPVHLQAKALGKQAAAKMLKRLGKGVAKKVPLIGVGFTILMAEEMRAQGYPAAEIEKAVLDDLTYNVPGMVDAVGNMLVNHAHYIAEGAMNNAFGYTTVDYDTEEFNGGNGLITSEENVDMILRRQTPGGHTVTAGDLIGGW